MLEICYSNESGLTNSVFIKKFRNQDKCVGIVVRKKPIICEELRHNFGNTIFDDVIISMKEEVSKSIEAKSTLLVEYKHDTFNLLSRRGVSKQIVCMTIH